MDRRAPAVRLTAAAMKEEVRLVPARLFDRREVFRLTGQEMAQLVEVLPRKSYEQAPKQLDTSRPVIVYCADQLCDLSPRAATRLEQLGFEQVYDHVLGKAD
ncbi:hypothetical protein QQY66_14870 [Streptomyces sp. DG2A-72]|uniref:rhodanese-like domain-containing protein n=1 Tax=Streptomyces sp. DG2A-72 TaxID=3051386 RepID=UPI00265BB7B0|nr:hypothetical protein [Streptomyces sp. DG2A-72]MDO0932914.1 hypothetical protein [Streptomyces sp. DG2A-72]